MTTREWAARYLARGWAIIPISARSKVPPAGFYLAAHLRGEKRLNEVDVAEWWKDGSTHGIAVLTGMVSGIVVADVDPRNGGELLADPRTLCAARTGGGGWHYFYEHPYNTTRTGKCSRPGVDRKASGGYVVVEP